MASESFELGVLVASVAATAVAGVTYFIYLAWMSSRATERTTKVVSAVGLLYLLVGLHMWWDPLGLDIWAVVAAAAVYAAGSVVTLVAMRAAMNSPDPEPAPALEGSVADASDEEVPVDVV